jgi:mono/diheme cytochrome c family protein
MSKRPARILGFVSLLLISALATINLAQKQTPAPAATPQKNVTKPLVNTAVKPAATNLPANLPTGMPVEAQQALVKQYCSGCHNDKTKSGGMSLTQLDLAHPEVNSELAEKVIKKTRVGLMPPAGMPRPDAATMKTFFTTLEGRMDHEASLHPNPGKRGFQRLTRTEYARSIHDLFGIDEDVAAVLPPDSLSGDGFDNLADAQGFSATLTEGYMRAAAKVTRDALGDPKAAPTSDVFRLPRLESQMDHIEGTPIGTRGGISFVYNFPADGEYNFRSMMVPNSLGSLLGANIKGEQLDVALDGARIALLDIDQRMSETQPTGLNVNTGKVFVKAGPHRVSAAFIDKHSGLLDDHITPIENTLASIDASDTGMVTVYPHLREFEISGPFNVSGVSDFDSRNRIFTCRPTSAAEEAPCASKIIKDLASRAYRRPANAEDLEGLMTFYERGRKNADFESGIRMATQAILTSPRFIFRFEQVPSTVKPGQVFRISDVDLASRLSYFLWNSPPDNELLTVASQGRLKEPLMLEKQVRRMLNDPRSESLATKFGGQWLHLPDLDGINPNSSYYPDYDQTLADAMKREIELFFDSIVREDRNVLDLLTANYTFVNERLARHYGIPNVTGTQFQRVELSQDYRRGLLGKAGILTLTSVADRTSPVYRGKWVMIVLFGTPPPAPPPAVPKLEETSAVAGGKPLTVRERMEAHRANAACASCHKMIDPLGLALENFDVTGLWRTMDKTASINEAGLRVRSPGVPIDTKTQLYDGTPMDGPATLREAILKHSDAVIQNLTEKLMAYALGRRVEYYDMPAIRAITRDAAKNNNRFSSLVLGIVKSPSFQMSKVEAVTTDKE